MKFLPLLLVWAVNDGEKIERHQPPQVSEPLQLFALRDEAVAFQVVLRGPLDDATVEVDLDGAQIHLDDAQIHLDDVKIERFVEHFFDLRRSSTQGGRSSLGWAEGSGPTGFTGSYPDALIPVELAPAWDPWPMRVAAGENAVVWVDLTVRQNAAPGIRHGRVLVRAKDQTATLPLSLEVLDATLPPRPIGTLLFYDPGTLRKRIGPGAEKQLWTLFHQHRVTPLHSVNSVEDLRAQLPALDGSFYPDHLPDDVIVLGTYGTLGDPTPKSLAMVEAIAAELPFEGHDVILYAEDEDCRSPRGAGWKKLLASSEKARRVQVAWTCSEDPSHQPVDVPIVFAGEYNPSFAGDRRAWIYNGYRPATGTLLTDSEAVSLRTFGWIAALAGIPRWFIWETTFWYDSNRGGHGPYDPFVSAETFHNRDGEASMGDGVLVYPGKQIDRFREHSLGLDGVIPSIRLKNLRRGIEDAGYYQLARAARPAEAEAIARKLFPRILAEARPGQPPSWPTRGRDFLEARRSLSRLIAFGADPGPTAGAGGATITSGKKWIFAGALVAMLLCVTIWLRRRGSA